MGEGGNCLSSIVFIKYFFYIKVVLISFMLNCVLVYEHLSFISTAPGGKLCSLLQLHARLQERLPEHSAGHHGEHSGTHTHPSFHPTGGIFRLSPGQSIYVEQVEPLAD